MGTLQSLCNKSYDRSTQSSTEDESKLEVREDRSDSFDVLVVGGGFSGFYCTYELLKNFPSNLKIMIIEKNATPGGRLMSDDNDIMNETNKDELGGMRIFPSKQTKVAALVKDMGLDLIPVKLTDDDNIFYYNSKHQVKKEVSVNGRHPKTIPQACFEEFRKAMPDEAKLDPYECKELYSYSLGEFCLKYGATQEEVDMFFSYSGYDIFSDNEVSAAVYYKDGELYGAKLSGDQCYVKQGYQEVVKRMAEKVKNKVTIVYESEVKSVKVLGKDNGYLVSHVSNGEENTNIKASHVIFALPHDSIVKLLPNVDGFATERRNIIRQSVKTIPLFKCFLEFDDSNQGTGQWWQQAGLICGKSTTDLEARQIHYYDTEDILVYCSGNFADFWNVRFENNAVAAAKLTFQQVQKVHENIKIEIPEPIWDKTVYKYWINGSHKWLKGVNVNSTIPMICFSNDSDHYVCGDAFSSYQGWVAGCIETSDICLEKLKKQLKVKDLKKDRNDGTNVM